MNEFPFVEPMRIQFHDPMARLAGNKRTGGMVFLYDLSLGMNLIAGLIGQMLTDQKKW